MRGPEKLRPSGKSGPGRRVGAARDPAGAWSSHAPPLAGCDAPSGRSAQPPGLKCITSQSGETFSCPGRGAGQAPLPATAPLPAGFAPGLVTPPILSHAPPGPNATHPAAREAQMSISTGVEWREITRRRAAPRRDDSQRVGDLSRPHETHRPQGSCRHARGSCGVAIARNFIQTRHFKQFYEYYNLSKDRARAI